MNKLYCGIDLHTKSLQICVIDEEALKVGEAKMKNDLPKVLSFLKPYGGQMSIAVESTINWYWLVDGLQGEGYDVTLAHSRGLSLITGAKNKSDRRDAEKLARLNRMGEIAPAYVYPKKMRPVRDLLRRRIDLVWERASCYTRMRCLFMQYNINTMGTEALKRFTAEDIASLPLPKEAKMHASLILSKVPVLSEQIETIEAHIHALDDKPAAVATLRTIPGFGPVISLVVPYEIGDVERFEDEKRFSSYARLFPGAHESAGKSRRSRCAKAGNPYLKWAFMQAAKVAAACVPEIRSLRDKHSGRRGGVALAGNAIIAHKLGISAFHMMKRMNPSRLRSS